MNKKLVAVAVSGALAAPAVAFAEAGDSTVSVYGRINNALQISDPDNGSSIMGLRNVVSRMGIKASTDLGNGLSAIGRYEFFTYTNREGNFDVVGGKGRGGINDTRLGYVGLSGAWGSVTVGNQWSAFYDTVGTHLEPTYSLGYYMYSSTMSGPYRTSNTIKYANSFGPVYVELDVRMSQNDTSGLGQNFAGGSGTADEEVLGRDSGGNADEIDGVGLGLSWSIGDSFTIAGAIDNDKKRAPVRATGEDDKRWGLAGKWTGGAWWATLGYYEIEVNNVTRDMVQAWVGGTFGKTTAMLGYGKANSDAVSGDPSQVTLGVYHNMGGGFRLYYEGAFFDDDNTGASIGKANIHLIGMRYDFST